MSSNGLSTGAVIGLTVGSLVDVAIIAFVVVFILRRREKTLRLLASAREDAEKARLTRSQRSDRQTRRAASTKRKVMEWRDVPGSSGGASNASGGDRNGLETVSEGRVSEGKGGNGGSGESDFSLPSSAASRTSGGLGGRIGDFFASPRKSRLWTSPFSSGEDPVELPADGDSIAPRRPTRMKSTDSSRSGGPYELPSGTLTNVVTSGRSAADEAASDWPRPLNVTPPAAAARRGMMPAAWQSARTSPSRKTAGSGGGGDDSNASVSVRPLQSGHGSQGSHGSDADDDWRELHDVAGLYARRERDLV